MSLSVSSILTCNITILIVLFFLYWFRQNGNCSLLDMSILIIFLIFSILRLGLPIEFPGSKTIFITAFLSPIIRFIYATRTIGVFHFSYWQLFIYIWGIGSIIKFIIFIIRYNNYRHFQKRISLLEQDKLKIILDILDKENISSEKYSFYSLPSCISPCCSGIFNRKIYLPISAYNNEEIYYILLHELSHFNYYDYFLKLLIELICIIQWWNPLIYLLKCYVYQLIEMRADANAVHNLNNNQIIAYVECLVKCSRQTLLNVDYLQTNLHGYKTSTMKRRCKTLLNNINSTNTHTKYSTKHIYSFLAFTFCLLSFMLTLNSTAEMNPVHSKETYFSITQENVFSIKTESGYELYVDNNFQGILESLPESLGIPVYSSKDEVPK